MKCSNPFVVKCLDGEHNQIHYSVGCGKCYACLSGRRKQWLFRLLYEIQDSKNSFFLTLTIAPEFVHLHLPVNKDYLRKFVKYLRNHKFVFKYYGIGEYGSDFGRPHYHICLFFKQYYDKQKLVDTILSYHTHGFIQLLQLTPRLSNYILHYHINPKSVNGFSTFQIFSKQLGISFIDTPDMVEYVKAERNQVTLFDGTRVTIPRYYRKKLGQPPKEEYYKDSQTQLLEKVFEKNIFQITAAEKAQFLKDISVTYQVKIAKMQSKGKF